MVTSWPEINHLYMVENFLRRMVPRQIEHECELSVTLTDTSAIMLVLEAVNPQHSGTCFAASMAVAEKINLPSADSDEVRKAVAETAKILDLLGQKTLESNVNDRVNDASERAKEKTTDTQNNIINRYNDHVKNIGDKADSARNSAQVHFPSLFPWLLISSLTFTLRLA